MLCKKEGTWFVFSDEEYPRDAYPAAENLTAVDQDFLYQKYPLLEGQLDQKDGTTITIEPSTGAININPRHFHVGIPTHDYQSTRQVNAGFSLPYYLVTTRSNYTTPLLILAGLLAAALFIGWFFYLPLVLYAAYQILVIAKIRDMYYSGDLNPAIVIDAEHNKIASLTDLSMGVGHYPIIRIRKYPLPEAYRTNGQKIPVAGAYQNTEDYSHWNFYDPNPLPSGIKDKTIIAEKLAAIPPVEWTTLQEEIHKFDGIPKEGYYPIAVEQSDWKDIDLSSITWMQFGEEK